MKLITAPNSVLKQIAVSVTEFDDSVRDICSKMIEFTQKHGIYGIGANMVGVLQRIIIVPKTENMADGFMEMINPEIIQSSEKTQIVTEASPSYPWIDADIARPESITVSYYDMNGIKNELSVTGFLSSIIQHEMDYLDGKSFLDYLPKVKAKLLREKMMKFIKSGGPKQKPHVHGPNCGHSH